MRVQRSCGCDVGRCKNMYEDGRTSYDKEEDVDIWSQRVVYIRDLVGQR